MDDTTPSLAISLYKDYRGFGIETELMKSMLDSKFVARTRKNISWCVTYNGIAYIPFDCQNALVAMISDFILKLGAVTVSVVYAEKNRGHFDMAGDFVPKESRIIKNTYF